MSKNIIRKSLSEQVDGTIEIFDLTKVVKANNIKKTEHKLELLRAITAIRAEISEENNEN